MTIWFASSFGLDGRTLYTATGPGVGAVGAVGAVGVSGAVDAVDAGVAEN